MGAVELDDEDAEKFSWQFGGTADAPWYEPSPGAFQTGNEAFMRQGYKKGREEAAVRGLNADGSIGPMAQAATIQQAQQAQARAAQLEAMARLQRQATGQEQGPSTANLQAQMQRDVGTRQALTARAGGAGLGASQEIAGQSQQAAIQQAAQTRAAEQAAAQRGVMELSGQGRGQDIGLATSQAGLEQQTALANQQAKLKQQEMNDKMVAYFEQMGFNSEQAQARAMQEQERMRAEQVIAQMNAQAGLISAAEEAEAQKSASRWGAIGSAVGAIAIAAFSDERVKLNIEDDSKGIDQFMDNLKPLRYDYASEKYGPAGKRHGIKAQDLEKTEIGKSMVIDTPEGKMVDYGQGFGTILSGMARLNARLRELEEKE